MSELCRNCDAPIDWVRIRGGDNDYVQSGDYDWIHTGRTTADLISVLRCDGQSPTSTGLGEYADPKGLPEFYAMWHEDIPSCGCGDPEAYYSLLRATLSLAPFYDNRQELSRLFNHNDLFQQTVLYILDSAELIEHGSNIDASWLTRKGEQWLSLINRFSYGQLSESHYIE